jgi:3-oxoadipate enol-lactonase
MNGASIAEINGTKLYYDVKGEGDHLVFVHDGLLDSRIWDYQFEAFTRRYTVTRYDARGYGMSEAPSQAFSDVEDLHSLLRFLGVEKAHLVGSSNGGRVAVDFALQWPEMVATLVLVGASLSGYRPSKDKLKRVSANFSGAEAGDVPRSVEAWLEDPYWAPGLEDNPTALQKVRQLLAERLRTVSSGGGIGSLLLLPDPPAIGRLSEIEVPTLVVVGERDDPDNRAIADLLAERIERATKRTVGGAGHIVNLERPEEFGRIVLGFLKDGP